jgi:hypothetical protein
VLACSYEGDAEDILVLETDVFGSPAYDEEVISNTDQEQTTFDEYPNEDDEEKSFPMVPVYDDYDSDPWESHEEEEEEPEGQFISCPEPISEKPSPRDQSTCIDCSPTCAYQRYSALCEQLWSRSGCLLQIF